jgi:hypothetical protein
MRVLKLFCCYCLDDDSHLLSILCLFSSFFLQLTAVSVQNMCGRAGVFRKFSYHIVVQAIKDIKRGQELLVNYGRNYWYTIACFLEKVQPQPQFPNKAHTFWQFFSTCMNIYMSFFFFFAF